MADADKLRQRDQREAQAKAQAVKEKRTLTYIDDDGCEVTVTSEGHVFYNASDWW